MPRTEIINIRMSTRELAVLDLLCKSYGLDRSNTIRLELRKAAKAAGLIKK
jgi:hypothetical protein